MEAKFNGLMTDLSSAKRTTTKIDKLKQISSLFAFEHTSPLLCGVVQSSNLIGVLAKVLKETDTWVDPQWIQLIIGSVYYYMGWVIPHNQTQAIADVVVEYFSSNKSVFAVDLLSFLVSPDYSSVILLEYNIYDSIKVLCLDDKNSELQKFAQKFILLAIFNSKWEQRVITDTKFLLALLFHDSLEMWNIFSSLSKHTDAKILIPSEVLKVARKIDNEKCIAICVTLCNETNAVDLKISEKFVETTANHLEALLSMKNLQGKKYSHGILSVTVPFVNLSIADSNKEGLGKRLTPLLLKLLAIERDKPLIKAIERNLERGKQEAAKILWNLAFLEANRTRIVATGGLEFLQKLLTTTLDPILKCNIEGILYMLIPQSPVQDPQALGKHIMISYNWTNQATVVRLANSLKARGYRVWIDVEQMKGSTLDAMARAIEGSAVVLLCFTQRYKDSPNCRLEGEYCINRKIDFIPLKMQRGYCPDGWLGIVLGTKLYYDFSSEDDWDNKVSSLVGDIGVRGKEIIPSATGPQYTAKQKSIETWDYEDLRVWMTSEGIGQHFDLFLDHKLDGKVLHTLKDQSNSTLLNCIKKFLKIRCLGDAVAIMRAIKNL